MKEESNAVASALERIFKDYIGEKISVKSELQVVNKSPEWSIFHCIYSFTFYLH